jgi:hypothetical protein
MEENKEKTLLSKDDMTLAAETARQKAKVERVAKDEGSVKAPAPEAAIKPEKLATESFDEEHVSHVELSEHQEETAMKAKESYTGARISRSFRALRPSVSVLACISEPPPRKVFITS